MQPLEQKSFAEGVTAVAQAGVVLGDNATKNKATPARAHKVSTVVFKSSYII